MASNDEIIVRIGADTSGLIAATADSSAAFGRMGAAAAETEGKFAAVTSATSGLERATAQATGRILGMESGLGMLGSSLGRVASYLPGLSEAFAVALPVALIGVAVSAFEQFHEAVAKSDREAVAFAADSYQSADAVALENLKLQSQIEILTGVPDDTGLRRALMASKIAAEQLAKSLDDGMQKAVELLNVGSLGSFFSWGSANEKQFRDDLQNILNDIQKAHIKLGQASPGSPEATAAINDQIKGYQALDAQLTKDIDTLQKQHDAQQKALDAAASVGGMPVDAAPINDSVAKLKDLQIGARNATAELETMKQNMALSGDVGALEERNAAMEKLVELQKQMIESQTNLNALKAQGAADQATSQLKLAGAGPGELMDAALKGEDEIYAAKNVGQQKLLDLYHSGGLKYQEQEAATNKAIEALAQEHENKMAQIRSSSTADLEKSVDEALRRATEADQQQQADDAKKLADIFTAMYRASLTQGMEGASSDIKKAQDTAEIQKQSVTGNPAASEMTKAIQEQGIATTAYNQTAIAIKNEQDALTQLKVALEASDLPLEKQLALFQEIEAAQQKMTDQSLDNNKRMQSSAQQTANQIQQSFTRAFMAINGPLQPNLDQVIRGTETIRFAFIKTGGDIAIAMINSLERMLVQQIATDLGMTVSHQVATQAQVVTTAVGAQEKGAIETQSSLKSIGKSAASAAAKAYDSLAAVPFVGVELGAVAAAATFVAVLAFGALIGSAERGAVVPEDMMIAAHANEMILPAHIATPLQAALPDLSAVHAALPSISGLHEAIRSGLASGGGGASAGGAGRGGSVTNHNYQVSAIDAASTKDFIHRNRGQFIAGMRSAIRNGVR